MQIVVWHGAYSKMSDVLRFDLRRNQGRYIVVVADYAHDELDHLCHLPRDIHQEVNLERKEKRLVLLGEIGALIGDKEQLRGDCINRNRLVLEVVEEELVVLAVVVLIS